MGFPKEVRVQVGYALSEAQAGRKAGYAKPLTQLGSGVIEILADHDGDTFRAVPIVVRHQDARTVVVPTRSPAGLFVGDRIAMRGAFEIGLALSGGDAVDAHHGHSH